MVVLRCTDDVVTRHKLGLSDDPPPSANHLGDWGVALATTPGGELVVFVNATTRLVVACPPAEIGDLLIVFKARLAQLLEELGVLEEEVEEELDEMATLSFAAARNVDWLEEAAVGLATAAARGVVTSADSLDLWQSDWARQPQSSLGGATPASLARRALSGSPTVH